MVKPVKYELIRCEINHQKLFFNGIKIDTKQDIKRITHSGDYDAIGYVTGEKTVDFSLTDPKDARMITRLYDTWVGNSHAFSHDYVFTKCGYECLGDGSRLRKLCVK